MASPTTGPLTMFSTGPSIMLLERSHSQTLSRGGLPNRSRKPPGASWAESSSWAARAPGGRPGSRLVEPVARSMASYSTSAGSRRGTAWA